MVISRWVKESAEDRTASQFTKYPIAQWGNALAENLTKTYPRLNPEKTHTETYHSKENLHQQKSTAGKAHKIDISPKGHDYMVMHSQEFYLYQFTPGDSPMGNLIRPRKHWGSNSNPPPDGVTRNTKRKIHHGLPTRIPDKAPECIETTHTRKINTCAHVGK